VKQGFYVAVKFAKKEFEQDPDTREKMLKEAQKQMTGARKNPGVIRVLDELHWPSFGIVMEFAQGNLHKMLGKFNKAPYQDNYFTLRKIFYEMLLILETTHRNGILHLDIKPANWLLVDMHPKLTDFGESVLFDPKLISDPELRGDRPGTPGLAPPEIMVGGHNSDKPYSGKMVDVHEMGQCFYEMLTGDHAGTLENHPDLGGDIRLRYQMRYKHKMPEDAIEVLEAMTKREWRERISIEQVKKMRFFNTVRKIQLGYTQRIIADHTQAGKKGDEPAFTGNLVKDPRVKKQLQTSRLAVVPETAASPYPSIIIMSPQSPTGVRPATTPWGGTGSGMGVRPATAPGNALGFNWQDWPVLHAAKQVWDAMDLQNCCNAKSASRDEEIGTDLHHRDQHHQHHQHHHLYHQQHGQHPGTHGAAVADRESNMQRASGFTDADVRAQQYGGANPQLQARPAQAQMQARPAQLQRQGSGGTAPQTRAPLTVPPQSLQRQGSGQMPPLQTMPPGWFVRREPSGDYVYYRRVGNLECDHTRTPPRY
jgi:serine/threonine protein kinase